MAKEIERKYLLKNDSWRGLAEGIHYRQGYLSSVKERTVRVRTIQDQGFLTIKGITKGVTRVEYEYPVPFDDAVELLDLCERPIIDKKRYKVAVDGLTWEIDEFFGENQGLVVAEVELTSEDQSFEKPSWVGEEVSSDPRYYNANLIKHPFCKW
jgi:CYTH domain-containing protein